MPILASQTAFTALFCSAPLCVGCCCINNPLRADQRERERERTKAIVAEEEMEMGRNRRRGGMHLGSKE